MGTKNKGFHRRSKGGDLGKSKFPGLGGVLKTSFSSTTLQEVGILPTLVYSYFLWTKNLFRTDLRVVWH